MKIKKLGFAIIMLFAAILAFAACNPNGEGTNPSGKDNDNDKTNNTGYTLEQKQNGLIITLAEFNTAPEFKGLKLEGGSLKVNKTEISADANIVIPGKVGEKEIKEIKKDVFAGVEAASIIIPKTIESIARGAFSGSAITSMTIPFVGGGKVQAEESVQAGLASKGLALDGGESVEVENISFFGFIFGGLTVDDNSTVVPESIKEVVIAGSGATIADWLKDFEIKNGLKLVTPHGLRATNITLLIHNGIDIKTVADRVGHKTTIMTLDTYTRYSSQSDAEAAEMLNNLLKPKQIII